MNQKTLKEFFLQLPSETRARISDSCRKKIFSSQREATIFFKSEIKKEIRKIKEKLDIEKKKWNNFIENSDMHNMQYEFKELTI